MADLHRYTGGGHTRGDGSFVNQGETFKPTEKEKAKIGDLLTPVDKPRAMQGADIGLRSLEWGSKAALSSALDARLSVEEMEDVGASGATGYVTSDVNRALEAREADDG